VDDVKAFLTHLAVEKHVSASSQNQAFNALLFVFRHVLGKEFGRVEGVVRAKKRPYVPVVLSRDEVKGLQVEAVAPQADQIQADDAGALAVGHDEGRHVLGHAADAAEHDIGADAAELVHGDLSGDEDVVVQLHVSGQGGGVGEDVVVADGAVVSDVAVGHEEVAAADARAGVVLDAVADVDAFLEVVVVADGQRAWPCPGVAEVLRLAAERDAVADAVVRPMRVAP
jgi:hypothetical protein